jgi:hypothetical protein
MIRFTYLCLSMVAAWASLLGLDGPARAQQPTRVHYKTVKVGDLDIFYREAGPRDAAAILLLHGFPTSSQMFRNLIPALADRYHAVAPDYPSPSVRWKVVQTCEPTRCRASALVAGA